ncbi:hypothetical protein Tco_0212001 [Tanacetum coccineum]
MVAFLEKTNGNAEFHEIINFLTRSSIHYALTVSPVVSTMFVEQFWMTAKSKTINNVRPSPTPYIPDSIPEGSGGYKRCISMDLKELQEQALQISIWVSYSNLLKDVPVPLDHFPVPTVTKKVLTFMVKKGKNFSRKVTPLFDSMLVQHTEDEGDASKRPSDSPPIPSPPYLSEDQPQIQLDLSPRPSPTTHIYDSIPEGSGRNHGGQSSNDASLSGNEDGLTLQSVYDLCVSLCKQVTAQAKEIKALKAQVKKLKKGVKPLIIHHKDWMKTRLSKKTSLKKKGVHKEYVSKQGRKSVKSFKDEGRTSYVVLEEKESANEGVSTEAPVSTDKQYEGTDKKNDGTDKQDRGTDSTKVSTDRQGEVLIIMSQNKEKLKEKEKGVEIRNIEDTERPRPTSTRSILTLRPLPRIDPKDKGKKRIEEEDESDTESEEITEAEKKFKQLANDEEVARNVQEEWEAEEEKKRLPEEEATKVALTNEYDFIQARIIADKILVEELQKKEREKFTIEQRAKFLHDTIHVGGKKHSELKTKTFKEIQVLYERLKRQDQNFVAIGSAEDERQIKELNKDPKKKRLKKKVVNETPREEDIAKVPAEQEVTEQGTKKRKSGHVKMIARKRPRPQPDDDSDDEHRKCLRIVTFEGTIDSEIMETKSFIARLHKVSAQVMKQYSEITPEDIELILWGDLKIMMESSTEENDQGDFWNNQQEWEIVRWRLYEACGVCILELKDGTVIYMLVERRVLNSPCFIVKSWLVQDQTVPVQKQTAFGKDKSNPLIVDSLLKTIRLSIHLVVYNEELAIPEQTATGKGISNPLMAGSLPKTTKPT